MMRNRSDRPSARAFALAAMPTARPRQLRLLICVLALLAPVAAPGVAGAAPPDPAAGALTAKLDVVPDGDGTVTIDPAPAGAVACTGSPDELRDCAYDVEPGAEVTLTATPTGSGVTLWGWSDARCPGTGSCTLPIDSDWQSVTALFSPQRVKVRSVGPGTVTTAAGAECQPTQEGRRRFLDCGRFEINTQVTLRANPSGPAVVPTWEGSLCDAPAPKRGDTLCTLSVYGVTWGSVGFDDEPGGDFSPTIKASFRVLKQGSGSGTVRSDSLDCGRRCAIEQYFGQRETLVADPAPDSTFMGWHGVCSTAPRCSLAIGPVTTVVAVFDDADTTKGGSPDPEPGAHEERPGSPPFAARLRRVAVTGHGRHRRVLMRVQVNAPATVRAVLRRGRDRVAGGRWRVRVGTPLLRLRVPQRARSGRYWLALSVRDAAGHAAHVTRRVWLPR
jgi:hypothetical protein